MAQVNPEHAALVTRLQDMWLKHMEKLLDSGEITSTDMATLARVLLQNGWSLDESRLPQSLRDKMPGLPPAGSLDDDDEDVIGKIA